MKRIIITMMTILSVTMSANAMSYEQARREALFLTDKMAYELNLTDQQYDAAYEINLDYLMGVTSVDDVYGTYWTRRNLDFGYILLDWQWNAFCAATYFYRPLYWSAGYWHFGIYARYPRRDYYYFSRPTVYVTYCGGHSWRHNGGHSYYKPRRNDFHHGTANHVGMRDRWNNGEMRRNNNRTANSSTRVTVNNNNNRNNSRNLGTSRTSGSFSGNRTATTTGTSRTTVTNRTAQNRTSAGTSRTSGSFGSTRSASATSSNITTTTPARSITTTRTPATSGSSRTFRTTTTTPSRSFGSAVRSGSTATRSTVSPSSKNVSRSTGSNRAATSGSFSGRR